MSETTFGGYQTRSDVTLDSMNALRVTRTFLRRMRSAVALLLVLCVVLAANGPLATVIEVTHTGDSGAGSLRDAINQANANPGPDAIEFNIPEDDPGFNGLWWSITIESALPALTDDGTQISGFSQAARRGDTNEGVVGTGGEVGVDRIPLDAFRRPEVAIRAPGFDALTIDGGASDILIEGLAIYGAQSGIVARGFEPGPDKTSPGSNRRIVESLIGVTPDGNDPDTERISRYGIVVWPSAEGADPTYLTVERCYVGYNGLVGIAGIRGATTLKVVLSEVFANGWGGNNHDGIDVNGVDGEITANLSRNNTNSLGTPGAGSGAGIEAGSSFEGGGGNTIENNTVVDNLGAGIAIRAGSSGNVVRRNISTRNAAGIVVSEEDGPATNRNLISENSTFDNDGLGIDLHAGNTNNLTDGVTLNSPTSGGSGSNNLQPYPVITRAVAADGEIILSGFASEGAAIEFFLADDEPEGFGEGRGFLITFIESSEDDEDPGSGTYGPRLIGSGMVSTEPLTAPAFAFRTSSSGIEDRLSGARITATESVGNNSSEFGPTVRLLRLPDRVSLSGPADEAEVEKTPIDFSWEPSGGTDTYEIQFSKTRGFEVVSDSAVGLTRPEYSYDRVQPGIPCFWRVRGVSDDGPGRWSDVWSFTFTGGTAPEQVVLLSPAPGIASVPTAVTFEWETADGAELYELQVSSYVPVDQGSFLDPVVSIETDQTSYPASGLEADRVYYWHVRGTNGSRSGPWSNVWSFSTGDLRPPPFVLLLSPMDGAVDVDPNTLFEWLGSDDAVSFVIEVTSDPPDGDGAFDTPDVRENLDDDSFVADLIPDTDYYWHILVINADGDSAWSPIGTFLTGPGRSRPGQVTLRKPDNDAFNVEADVLFEWFDARDAEEYVFELYRTDDGVVSLLDSARTAETTLRYEMVPLTDSLSWRVRALNGVGPGAWSRTFRFSRDEDPRSCTVGLLRPSPGAVDVSTITFIAWSATQIPDFFRLEITDAAADTVVVSATLADSSYSPTQPLVNGVSYDWRVRCESPAGNGPFATGSFTTIRYRGEFLEPLGKTRLVGNHPNPFNARTTIHFELEDASPVELSVFDVNGRRVAVLATETREAGTHEVVWDGRFASGAPAPSGLYLYRIVADSYVEIKSMTLLK